MRAMKIEFNRRNNCLKNTIIDMTLEISQEISDVIFYMFYKNANYVDWFADHHNFAYTENNTISSRYKNGNLNGEIVIDNVRQCWYFARANGWVVLPFKIGKYTFTTFATAYFNNIDKFDKMFANYVQETLLNKYFID